MVPLTTDNISTIYEFCLYGSFDNR